MERPKQLIGRVEKISLPAFGVRDVYARIDTGAKTSAIWVSKAQIHNGRLEVVLFGKSHEAYTGEVIYFDHFTEAIIASSNGQTERRFKVQTVIEIAGRKIRARLTLADRSTQTYPVLIGRNVLHGKFIVDVKLGSPQRKLEKLRSVRLQAPLKDRSSKA